MANTIENMSNNSNHDPIEHVKVECAHINSAERYVNVTLTQSTEKEPEPSSTQVNGQQHRHQEIVGGGDEGISDCSPGASERDSCSPALPERIPVNVKQENVTPIVSPNKYVERVELVANETERLVENDKELLELRLALAKHKVDLERAIDHIHYLEEVNLQQGLARAELDAKYQTLSQRYENANREKEATVMRYATSEKSVIEQRNAKENLEKQLRDATKEIELLNNKVSMLNSEKSRICQMLDNKCHELISTQKEMEKIRTNVVTNENNVKSLKSMLKNENEARKELQMTIDSLNNRLQMANQQIDTAKRDAQESIRAFRESQENKAFLLDKQLKEATANLILVRHECSDREQRSHHLQLELDNLQEKYEKLIQENNELSLKIQQLEQERLENGKKITELRETKNKESEQITRMKELQAQLDEMKMKLANKEDKLVLMESQVEQIKQQNLELQIDLEARVHREEDMLKFTQSLTEKNVRLQSEYSTLETKVQQLQCEQETLRRTNKEIQSRLSHMSNQLDDEKTGRNDENTILTHHLAEKTQEIEKLKRELDYQKGENQVLKRKFDNSLKQMTKELHQCHKKIEQIESSAEISHASKLYSSESPSTSESPIKNQDSEQSSPKMDALNLSDPVTPSQESDSSTSASPVIQTPLDLDKNALLEHVMRLQRISARKSEKLDFLESHVQALVGELQKKTRLLQDYMVREQTGALTSNAMDNHKNN